MAIAMSGFGEGSRTTRQRLNFLAPAAPTAMPTHRTFCCVATPACDDPARHPPVQPASVAPPSDPLARAAAELIDLSRARKLLHLGDDGTVLVALLQTWPALSGVWLGTAAAQASSERLLTERGLHDRIRYQAADALTGVDAGDLIVLNALGAAASAAQGLVWLTSAGEGWLPPSGRWLILQRPSPHPDCAISPERLHAQGLRVASTWALADSVQMLVCAPAHRFVEALGSRINPLSHRSLSP
jgi:hypothetical protein